MNPTFTYFTNCTKQMATVTIITPDQHQFVLPKATAKLFEAVKDVMECADTNDEIVIPISTPKHIFETILRFIDKFSTEDDAKEKEWLDSVTVDKIEFFSLIQETNKLGYTYLFKLICKRMAQTITEICNKYEAESEKVEKLTEYLEFMESDMTNYYSRGPTPSNTTTMDTSVY